jgi:hypothetical protein
VQQKAKMAAGVELPVVLVVFVVVLLRPCEASTHWMVTEDGRVQAQVSAASPSLFFNAPN